MQLFPCPFCGLRDETEFHYGGDAGNVRPDGTDVPIDRWADYLYLRSNPKGTAREIWVHMNCSEFFVMERDTVTHKVLSSTALGAEHAERLASSLGRQCHRPVAPDPLQLRRRHRARLCR